MNEWESEALRKSPLFDGVSNKDFDEIINCIKPIVQYYKRGEVILHSSDSFRWVGVILKGCASAYHESVDGERMLLCSATPGEVAGITALLSESQFSANLIAGEDCIIVLIRPFFIEKGCTMKCHGKHFMGHQKITNNFINILVNRFLYLYKRTIYLSMKSVHQKVCTYLFDQKHIQGSTTFVVSMDRAKLADYLNIPRPSLSRELCILRNNGLIDFHKFNFSIINLPEIIRYASSLDKRI